MRHLYITLTFISPIQYCLSCESPFFYQFRTVLAMRASTLLRVLFTCLSIHFLTANSLVALNAQSQIRAPSKKSHRSKRQRSALPNQIEILPNLSVSSQEASNVTSTAGTANSAVPAPEVFSASSKVIADGIDCNNITTGRNNKCWAHLNLTQWVQGWLNANICHLNEPFASCFLRLEGFPGLDCTGIKISACTAPQGDTMLKEPQVFYVAYNIYGTLCHSTFEGLLGMTDKLM